MIYQWEAKILNKIYRTHHFTKLLDMKVATIEDLNYRNILAISDFKDMDNSTDII